MNAKRLLSHVLLLILSSIFLASGADWNLIWSEEFNIDGPIDTTRWHLETGTGSNGWGNNELQYYTDKPENAYIRSSNLEITIRRQDTAGKKFTSARLITLNRFSFQYGKVEARLKVLKGKGMWPAFWMMGKSFPTVGWPGCGKIDIMEVMNRGGALDDNIVLATVYWLYDANNTHAQYGRSDTSATPLADSFHVYGLTWDRQYIRAFLDGTQFWEIDITPSHLSEFHQPFFLLLNAAVGGSPLNITNPADITATLPQTMLVDYVRVYQEAASVNKMKEHESMTNTMIKVRYHGRVLASIPIKEYDVIFPTTLAMYALNGKEITRQRFADRIAVYDIELPCGLPARMYCVTVGTGTRASYYRFFNNGM